MARQTRRDFEWIVVDDGDVPITPTMGQIYQRMEPSADTCTLQRNLITGLQVAGAMKPDAILIIEDDDWYHPRYVELMAEELATARMAGEMRRLYYHVPTKGYLSCYNRKHAALAATGIRGSAIGEAIRSCQESLKDGRPYVDLWLWGVMEKILPRWMRVEEIRQGRGRKLFSCKKLSVGIKGMPGRGGLGAGHDASPYRDFDRHGRVLREWVGEEDAAAILAVANGAAVGHIAAP